MSNTETDEKMIRVAWKTAVMAVHAYVYYHTGCYDASVVWPDQEVSEVPASQVAVDANCSYCYREIKG